MKNFLKSVFILGTFSCVLASRADEREDLCPRDSIPILDGAKNIYGEKFRGINDDPLAVESTRTYCIPLLSERDYMLLASRARTPAGQSDVGVKLDLVSPSGEITSLSSSADKMRLDGVEAGAYLVRISTFLKNGKSCANSPSLCKNPVNVTLHWKLFDIDPNLKLRCPSNTTPVQIPHGTGWTYVKSSIRGGDTNRYCVLSNKPWFGIEFALGSYTQQSCGKKTMKAYSSTQTGIEPKQGYFGEGALRFTTSVRAGVWIIEVKANQPEMTNCTESFNIAWRHTEDRLF